MKDSKRGTTIYFDSEIHRVLKLKGAATHQSLSAIVNEAVRQALAEDAADLAAFQERAKEPNLTFNGFLKNRRWHMSHIKKGLRQAKAGKFASERDVVRALARRRR